MPVNASGLNKTELKDLKALLDKKHHDLTEELKLLEDEIKEEGASEEQGAPDEFDRSSYEEGMQRAQIVLDGKYQLLTEVKAAIDRMNAGNYGVCEVTEEPIGIKRLKAQPWTRFSIEAQKEVENNRKLRSMSRGYAGASTDDDDDGTDD